MGSKKVAMQIRPAIMRKSLSFVHSGTRSEECFTEWKFFFLNESHLEQTTSFMDKVKYKFHLAIFLCQLGFSSWALEIIFFYFQCSFEGYFSSEEVCTLEHKNI